MRIQRPFALNVKLTKSQREQIELIAMEEEKTMSELVRGWIESEVKKYQRKSYANKID